MESKLRECFDEMVVYKDLKRSNFFSSLGLPSFLRDWVLKKFEDDEGNYDIEEVTEFIQTYLPRKEEWISIKNRIIYENERVKILTKVGIDIGGQMMNYEVNPFQDYESITIDELKDQANSLLNLVTEEQRPLRVCMNSGKEFLLFSQDLLAPICDSDFRLILLSAMRYAMGRNTCMPMVVADYIKRHIQLLDDKFLVLAADEIRRHLEDYAEHEPNPNLWHDLLGALETEQRERATRKARKIRLCPACGKPLEVMSIADNRHSPGGFDDLRFRGKDEIK